MGVVIDFRYLIGDHSTTRKSFSAGKFYPYAKHAKTDIVNSSMFAGINVCIFEAKPCSRGLIFVVSSDRVSHLGT